MKLFGRIAWAIIAAGATGVAFWVGARPSASIWQNHSWLLYVTGAVLVVNVFLPAVAKAWLEAFPQATVPRTRQVQQVVNSGFLRLATLTGLDMADLGLNAYRIRRRFGRKPVLERIADLRFKIPPPTQMTWTKGKGIIGICWETEQWAIGDTGKAYEQAQAISDSDWVRADRLVTMRLSRKELERTKDYGVIAANPMFNFTTPPKIFGCLAITAPSGTDAALDTPEVKELLRQLSNSVWAAWKSPES